MRISVLLADNFVVSRQRSFANQQSGFTVNVQPSPTRGVSSRRAGAGPILAPTHTSEVPSDFGSPRQGAC